MHRFVPYWQPQYKRTCSSQERSCWGWSALWMNWSCRRWRGQPAGSQPPMAGWDNHSYRTSAASTTYILYIYILQNLPASAGYRGQPVLLKLLDSLCNKVSQPLRHGWGLIYLGLSSLCYRTGFRDSWIVRCSQKAYLELRCSFSPIWICSSQIFASISNKCFACNFPCMSRATYNFRLTQKIHFIKL